MRSASEQGYALVATLFVVFLAGTVSTLAMQRSRGLARDTLLARGRLEAFFAAEGGVAQARHGLLHDPGWNGGRLRIGRASVRVSVRRLAADAPRFAVTAVGSSRVFGPEADPVRARIEAVVEVAGARAKLVSWRELR